MSSINFNLSSIISYFRPFSSTQTSVVEQDKTDRVFKGAIEMVSFGPQESQTDEVSSLQQKVDSSTTETIPESIGKNDFIYEGMLKDLSAFDEGSDALTPYQIKIATDTINQYRSIDAEIESIKELSGDHERNEKINALTRGGAEGGFSAIPPEMRVGAFLAAYDFMKADQDKSRDRLRGFFSCFSLGDTCLSNKTENLNQYYASMLFPNLDLTIDMEKALQLPAYLLSLIMSDEYFAPLNDVISAEQVKAYVLGTATGVRQVNRLAEEFGMRAEQGEKTLSAFLAYLSERGIYTEQNVNYRDLVLSFINSDAFATAQCLGLQFL